jgi:hypothetical protein
MWLMSEELVERCFRADLLELPCESSCTICVECLPEEKIALDVSLKKSVSAEK